MFYSLLFLDHFVFCLSTKTKTVKKQKSKLIQKPIKFYHSFSIQLFNTSHLFQVCEPIGKGEFCEVMLGKWKNQKVAVKVLKDSSEAEAILMK